MTVDVQIPYNDLLGDGTITVFNFTFGLIETLDLLVLVDGILQYEYSDYTVGNLTEDEGGDVTFITAPDDGARVLIIRRTTLSQQIDYDENEPFPVETHERAGFDKFMYILQELISGAFLGLDSVGDPVALTFDLSVTPNETTVTINNSGGTDAVIPPWVSAELAGVYHCTIDVEANLPDDEAVTTKPDGHIWLGY